MAEAGYSDAEAKAIKKDVDHFTKLAEEMKLASGDYIDMKQFEPGMRQLLDTFIRAEPSEIVTNFDDMSLVELLVKKGEGAIDDLPARLKSDHKAVAETIENNIRKVIVEETQVNPKYYDRMSELLDALIEARRNAALDYKAYLAKIVELAKQVTGGPASSSYPSEITSSAQRAFYDNLKQDAGLVVSLDEAIRRVKKDGWRGNPFKEKEVKKAILQITNDQAQAELVFDLAVAQRDY